MPYYINHTNGTSLVTVEDGTVDNTTTSINLVGKSFPTYGQLFNQNFVNLLENFSNTSAPDTPLIGQIWYDSANKNLSFYREGSTDSYWQKVAMTYEGTTAPSDPRLGDLWWDTNPAQLKIYDSSQTPNWRVIGPQTTNNGQLNVTSATGLVIQVSGNNSLQIDASSAVILNYNPCFYGYGHTSGATSIIGSGITTYNAWKPKPLSTTIDKGTNWDAVHSWFNVNTTGVYRVTSSITTLGGGNINLKWQVSGSDQNISSTNNHTSSEVHHLTCSGLIRASSGTYIQLLWSADSVASVSTSNATYSIEFVG